MPNPLRDDDDDSMRLAVWCEDVKPAGGGDDAVVDMTPGRVLSGVVKAWRTSSGYGTVVDDDSGASFVVEKNALATSTGSAHRALRVGQRVTFCAERPSGGVLRARDVKRGDGVPLSLVDMLPPALNDTSHIAHGTVTQWLHGAAFGFLIEDSCGVQLMVHRRALVPAPDAVGLASLEVGQRVEFRLGPDDTHPQRDVCCLDVRSIGGAPLPCHERGTRSSSSRTEARLWDLFESNAPLTGVVQHWNMAVGVGVVKDDATGVDLVVRISSLLSSPSHRGVPRLSRRMRVQYRLQSTREQHPSLIDSSSSLRVGAFECVRVSVLS